MKEMLFYHIELLKGTQQIKDNDDIEVSTRKKNEV